MIQKIFKELIDRPTDHRYIWNFARDTPLMTTLNSLPLNVVCNILINVDGHPKLGKQCTLFDSTLRIKTHLTWICPRKSSSLWDSVVRHIHSAFPVLSAAGHVRVEEQVQTNRNI